MVFSSDYGRVHDCPLSRNVLNNRKTRVRVVLPRAKQPILAQIEHDSFPSLDIKF